MLIFNCFLNFFWLFPDLSLINIFTFMHAPSHSVCYKWQGFRMDRVLNKSIIKCANISMLERIQDNIVCSGKRSNNQDCHCRINHLGSNQVIWTRHNRESTEEYHQKRTVLFHWKRWCLLQWAHLVFESWVSHSFVLRPLKLLSLEFLLYETELIISVSWGRWSALDERIFQICV